MINSLRIVFIYSMRRQWPPRVTSTIYVQYSFSSPCHILCTIGFLEGTSLAVSCIRVPRQNHSGMDVKDCPTARDNWKYLSDNWTSHPTCPTGQVTCPTGQVKFEPSFVLKAVVGTENTANKSQTKCGQVNFQFWQVKIILTCLTGQFSK